MTAVFDHLAVAAASLDEGVAAMEAALGLPLQPGGRHAAMGTHNRLIGMGPGTYLEVIAIDPEAPPPGRPRWFALDGFRGAPRPRAWILRDDALEAALSRAPAGTGTPMLFRRDALTWRMAVPDTGVLPFDGVAPALIEWGAGVAHPATRLPDQGLRLSVLTLLHPEAEALRGALAGLCRDSRLRIETGPPGIVAEVLTPHGRRVLE
ncbi:MAG: VOC family protein [Rhodobacter sp.]|uniref:VOC family protein n=1 Tax=Pararhodobacter sp. TaxID=2127056 RepID=UPI001D6AAA4D|nr:VOC family protein [Pararhodobacter sp.]MCB1346823.1 VOC family protein [Paracoccaceae bacterium]MCC0073234.1 VOC family protein [Rhodobacter sp.]HPD94073.1 VOC family protein [Pararhodobacter sp.]